MLFLYYFSHIFFTLSSDFLFLTLAISVFILYEQILKKKDDLFKIFLVILPSISPLSYNGLTFNSSIYIFNIALDPVLIASLMFFYRNCISINLNKISFSLSIYFLLFLFAFIQLMILFFNNQSHNQGLTYAFRAILYLSMIFTIYKNDLYNFDNQFYKIILISIIIIFFRQLFLFIEIISLSGHLIFFIASQCILLFFLKKKLINILLYFITIFIFINQSFTLFFIFFISNILIIFRKWRVLNNLGIIIFLINFQIIFLIFLNYDSLLFGYYNDENYFIKKLLYDRFPLFKATLENLTFFQFRISEIFIEMPNIISVDGSWAYGSHNYFLTLTNKLGLVPVSIIFLIINIFFLSIFKNLKKLNKSYHSHNKLNLYFLTLLSSFAIWSVSGNAYAESMGFLFFLILGSLNSVVRSVVKS